MARTGQVVFFGAKAEWTIGCCKPISKMLEGTIFPSMQEKDRVHTTRISDTSFVIEGDSDDERKTHVHLFLGSRVALIAAMPRDCWNCRACHWTAVQNSFT